MLRYIVDITIDVAEPNIKFNQVSIFPNPVADYLSIEFNLKSKNQLSLYLTDNMGKVLKTYFSQQIHGSGLHKYNLELSYIDSGIYYLRIIDNNTSYIKKIIK